MNKRIVIGLFLLTTIFVSGHAQNERFNFSPEKFRQAEEGYIAKKAHLTPSESAAFCKLYNEYKDAQAKLYSTIRECYKKSWNKNLSDEDYTKLLTKIENAEVALAKLKQNYIRKYQKILPGKKVYQVVCAEYTFHRDMLKGAAFRHH